jgi:hypothetical protein
MTEKRRARPVPAMPTESWFRSKGSSGPDFLRDKTAVFSCRLSIIKDRRLSHALK